MDSTENSLLSENQPHFVLCLDTLAATDALYLHVSKPPKAGTYLHTFYASLVEVGKEEGVEVSMVHRKINLQDHRHPWEHHKYSMRRLPAATLSALADPEGYERGSVVDTQASVDTGRLVRHISVLNKAIVRHIYAPAQQQRESAAAPQQR